LVAADLSGSWFQPGFMGLGKWFHLKHRQWSYRW